MPSNTAAWLVSPKQTPLEVKSAPYTPPQDHEIVVRNGAVAINPVDWAMQAMALFPIEYPAIGGFDLAGEVVEVGSSVTRFSKGDRVLAYALMLSTKRESNKTCEGAFQTYTVIRDHMASQIPSTMSFEQAAVIPLGLSTSACGMFQKEYLALQHPSLNPKPTNKALLVWGGASSVGSNAIQLGCAAGYEVITTASSKNFEYVKKLGASQTFDYNSNTVVDELVAALEDKTNAGFIDCIGQNGSWEACADVALRSKGGKFIAASQQPPKEIPEGVSSKFIIGSALVDNEISKLVYEDFLPRALAAGKFIAAPDPQVVGRGLEYVQEALDTWVKGVSAKKVVVSL